MARMAQDCKFKFLDYFSQENFYFLMMLTAWLMIVNILITLANETSILDDGNCIVTETFVK